MSIHHVSRVLVMVRFSRRPTSRYKFRAVAKSFWRRACVLVSSEKLPSNNHAEGVTLLSDITCSRACFIKHSDHIIAFEIDILDSSYALSTALKRLQAL
jgi:hypothetical protein